MNKKRKISLKSIIILILSCGILLFSIVSFNSEHISLCCGTHCMLCSAINFSQKIVMIVVATIVIFKIAMILIYYFLAETLRENDNKIIILNTLVNKKIQFNE